MTGCCSPAWTPCRSRRLALLPDGRLTLRKPAGLSKDHPTGPVGDGPGSTVAGSVELPRVMAKGGAASAVRRWLEITGVTSRGRAWEAGYEERWSPRLSGRVRAAARCTSRGPIATCGANASSTTWLPPPVCVNSPTASWPGKRCAAQVVAAFGCGIPCVEIRNLQGSPPLATCSSTGPRPRRRRSARPGPWRPERMAGLSLPAAAQRSGDT